MRKPAAVAAGRKVKSMYRNIDVKTEMSKIASSKPVYAVAGAGALASRALRDLPGRLARWRTNAPVTSLSARATGYMQVARAKAAGGYDRLADRGKQVLNGSRAARGKTAKSS
jgi:hypothetical protein